MKTQPKPVGHCKSSDKGKVHSNTGNKKQEKSQINNLTLHLKQLEKEEMKNPRVSRRKEIKKIRAETNAIETKETIAKINKAKSWFFEKTNKTDKPGDRSHEHHQGSSRCSRRHWAEEPETQAD